MAARTAGPGAVNLRIRIGDEVELSPAAREALENPLNELNDAEVSGFAAHVGCPKVWDDCNPLTCNLTNCQPLVSKPCFVDMDCHVTPEFGRRMT